MVIEEIYGEVAQLESEPVVVQIGKAPEDVPFSLPAKWLWMSLNDVLLQISDGSHNPPPNSGVGIPVLSAKNVHDGIIDTQAVTRWTTEEQWVIEDRKVHIESGDVLLTIVGTIGRTAVVPDDALKFMLQRSVCVMKPKNFLRSEFLALMLTSPTLLEWMADRSSGTAQKGIYLKILKTMPIPIPPLGEQQRIIDKLNEIRSVVEVYGKEQQLVELLKGSFANKLKNSILQEAIQGKLVPQLESEPAVEQIGKLIDTKPFSIPSKWKWAQLKNVTTKITDGTHHSPPSANKGDFLYITAKNIKSTGVDLTNVTYVSKEIHEEIFKRCNPEYGDVLFIKDGATTGVVTINYLENPFSLLSSVALLKVKRELLLPEFLVYVLRSQYARGIVAKQMQGTGIPRVTLKKLKDLWIPIPPLNEQHRISQKLQDLITAMPLF